MLHEITLGLVQGLTEFLPVSSSGHLVIVPAVLGWDKPSLTFDIFLHMGTLVAVMLYFRRELAELLLGILGRGPNVAESRRLATYIVVGTVPAGALGLVFSDFFERLFRSPTWTCFELVVTAGLLLSAEQLAKRSVKRELDATSAISMGLAQAIAISPGVSRSGATISAGLWLGLSRETATRYSFLLSIPAIAGAGLVSIKDASEGSFDMNGAVVAGMIVSGVSGYLAIGALIRYLKTHTLHVFAYYLLIAAPIAAVIIQLRK